MVTRRDLLKVGSAAVAGTALLPHAPAAEAQGPTQRVTGGEPAQRPGQPGRDFTPVVTPNLASLPWRVVDGVKVFHLVAEPVRIEMAPGLNADCWGYNGMCHGPTIEVVEGDRCRFYVTNRLQEATTVHWHGVVVPNGMDGVAGLTQQAIPPGATFKYEFTFRFPGTFMYHPHFDEMTQMGMGLMGMLIVHPRRPRGPRVDRDFAIMLSEWFITPGTSKPDPLQMAEFNVLTMNARAFPGTEPLIVRQGERVRIRLGNLSAMDHHPIHLHGFSFEITATDGGTIPPSARWPETTVLVPVGSTRDIEFVADNPGDWALHCHMTHHIMNQMGHETQNMIGVRTGGLDRRVRRLIPGYMSMGQNGMGGMGEMEMPLPPNSIPMLGARGPFGLIDMGGMFTIVKVHPGITSHEPARVGWFDHPQGTVAGAASEADLRRDQIDLGAAPPRPATTDDGSHEGH